MLAVKTSCVHLKLSSELIQTLPITHKIKTLHWEAKVLHSMSPDDITNIIFPQLSIPLIITIWGIMNSFMNLLED